MSEVSRALVLRLPPYMLPRHLWWLPAAPQTPHGKTDRLAVRAEAARRVGAGIALTHTAQPAHG